jgi:hypothetical protein
LVSLWYNRDIINKKPSTTPKCSQCGSALILVSKITEKLEGYRYAQTSTVYRCSNQDCQDDKDKETAKRLKFKEDRAQVDKKREELKLEKKMKMNLELEKAAKS